MHSNLLKATNHFHGKTIRPVSAAELLANTSLFAVLDKIIRTPVQQCSQFMMLNFSRTTSSYVVALVCIIGKDVSCKSENAISSFSKKHFKVPLTRILTQSFKLPAELPCFASSPWLLPTQSWQWYLVSCELWWIRSVEPIAVMTSWSIIYGQQRGFWEGVGRGAGG